ncbi:hypothetical protein B0H10DRAFT_811550 [Mycena sp. CBHHK59/15]|nr:hypothetical protein B0H10DRAFT_811550 [Mycena sp. CBHHK59/15]
MFLADLATVTTKARLQDIIVIVICGHGEPNGDIRVGDEATDLTHLCKDDVEAILTQYELKIPQANVYLVSTACYAGRLRSNLWTLFGGSDSEEESMAIRESGSGEFRGGIFTFAAFAERADEHGLVAPHTITVDYSDGQAFSVDTFAYRARSDPIPSTLLDPSAGSAPAIPRRSTYNGWKV